MMSNCLASSLGAQTKGEDEDYVGKNKNISLQVRDIDQAGFIRLRVVLQRERHRRTVDGDSGSSLMVPAEVMAATRILQ